MFDKVISLAPSLLVKNWAFHGCPFKKNILILTCYKWTCKPVEFSKRLFLEQSATYQVFCCPCPNLLKMCCCDQIKNKNKIISCAGWVMVYMLLLCLVATYSEDSLKREKQTLSSGTMEEGTDAKCRLIYNTCYHCLSDESHTLCPLFGI